MRARLALIACLAACGGGRTPATTPPPDPAPQANVAEGPDLSPDLAVIQWLAGDWQSADGAGREHWVATAGVLYGVAFAGDDRWEVMIVDDGTGDGPPDGTLRLDAMPMGAPPVTFTGPARGAVPAGAVEFTNPAHDDPKAIRYEGGDRALRARVVGASTLDLAFTSIAPTPAPEAEEADRAFARDTDAEGVEGWVRWFTEDGAQISQGRRIEGRAAIGELMAPLLGRVELRWVPVWSRISPSGNLAATVGRAAIDDGGRIAWRGSYVTIWRKTPQGWRVLFDTGRDEQPLL